MIDEAILRKYKAGLVRLHKGEMVVRQGSPARDFLIVRAGRVKMVTYTEEGREFVQGFFGNGESFGEPPFFNRLTYPASAVAEMDSEVWKIPYDAFMKLLRENFDDHLQVTRVLARRLVYKSIMLSEIAVEEARHRLTTLIEFLRKREGGARGSAPFTVPLTRKQLADMTGLRVETVIRTIKAMEQEGRLRIDRRGKVLWNAHQRSTNKEE